MGARKTEKLTDEAQDDHARDEREFPKLVVCADCVHYVSCLYCLFVIITGCHHQILTTGRTPCMATVCEMVRMLNILVVLCRGCNGEAHGSYRELGTFKKVTGTRLGLKVVTRGVVWRGRRWTASTYSF